MPSLVTVRGGGAILRTSRWEVVRARVQVICSDAVVSTPNFLDLDREFGRLGHVWIRHGHGGDPIPRRDDRR